jgi:hypothetical protein
MTASFRWRRFVALVVVGTALSVFLSSCGDDSDSESSSASTAGSESSAGAAPEDVIVPDSEVTTGLNQSISDMHALATEVAAGSATEDQFEKIHEGWESYEGTIKQNDPEAYLGLEDALAAMQKAVKEEDSAAAKQAAEDFDANATTYLAAHP